MGFAVYKTTSDIFQIGKVALRSSFPQPFPALSTLLFSEKKPGDLPTRQLIVELWLILFDLFDPPASKRISAPPSRPNSLRFDTPPDPKQYNVNITSAVRALLVPDEKEEKEVHEFMTAAHRPRVFKAWVGELSDLCRDYFWFVSTCPEALTLQGDVSWVEHPLGAG